MFELKNTHLSEGSANTSYILIIYNALKIKFNQLH